YGHVQVIGRGAACLEHLDGAHRGREILVLRRAEGVISWRVGEEILEGPAAGPPAGEVARRMRVGVAEAGQHEMLASVDLARARGSAQVRAHRGNAIVVDQDVRAREGGRRAREETATADD